MSATVMTVRLSSPTFAQTFVHAVHLRFRASDGWRGIQPGHESARAVLVEGVMVVRELAGTSVWIVSEAGLVWIERNVVIVLTRWASVATSLVELRERVADRDLERARVEAETRAMVQRHENATRRVLAALERRVGR